MYFSFNHIPKGPNLANFELFRKGLAHLFTILSRLTSGKTYLDTSSVQACVTPLIIESNINVDPMARLESKDHLPNLPRPVKIISWSAFGIVTLDEPHTFVKGMPVKYRNVVYYVSKVIDNISIILGKYYNDEGWTGFESDLPAPNEYLYFAYPMAQIEERYLTPRNNTYPIGTGSLAYGEILGSGTNRKSTLYFNNGSGFKQVKLGLDLGNTYYNPNKTEVNKHTGWCHGMGNYKIITSSLQIEILFDYIQVREDVTELRSIVPCTKSSELKYDILITSGSTGLNGIDSGIVQANKGYYVYFLYNRKKDTYGAILSLNPDKPDPFPIDDEGNYYKSYQRLGWVQTDAEGNFLPSAQVNGKYACINLPSAVSTLSFKGAGTSSDIPVITEGYGYSSKYPYNYYLKSADVLVNAIGTCTNTSNIRVISLEGREFYSFSGTSAYYKPTKLVSEYNLVGTNVDFNIAHPEDMGAGTVGTTVVTGTDFTAIGIHLTGFTFDKGAFHL